MLTGDSESGAKSSAEALGITEYRSQVLPEDKASIVESLKEEGRTIIMVGDGINDSPALAAADVSVSMKTLQILPEKLQMFLYCLIIYMI